MDNSEAMYWLAVVRQANKGDKEAMEVLRQEDEMRTQQGLMTVVDELEYLTNKDKQREMTIASLKEIVRQSRKNTR